MFASNEGCCDTGCQSLQGTCSASISSSGRRNRISRSPTPPSSCEESAHYPVFNPEDPRHNSALRTSVSPESANGLHQSAHVTRLRHWMQRLPGRSLRRAHSGLQALISSLHRRCVHQNTDRRSIVVNGVWPLSNSAEGSSDQDERFFSSIVSEASTDEDYDFGTHLYRTRCNYPEFCDEIGKDLGSPTDTKYSHSILLPAINTEVEAPLMDPMESAPEDSPGEELSPVTPGLDNPGPVDTHRVKQEEPKPRNLPQLLCPHLSMKEQNFPCQAYRG
ncbi:hypothetical protein BJX63DRAFT_163174 [Aspergillus granulosus]|uniref:Uncharacterized protein n=1 Tax=Aspergillus granulosus TaxID=176169 RepID=A0ABR4HKN3_9EURO